MKKKETKGLSPDKKLSDYQNKLLKSDLQLAITEIQKICNFNPPLDTRGNMDSLKNRLYMIAYTLDYVNDSQVFSSLTNWVLHKLTIRGWASRVDFRKPEKDVLFNLQVAKDVYEQEVIPKVRMNNYDYPYSNPFNHMDSDDIALCVQRIMFLESNAPVHKQLKSSLASKYAETLRIIKYTQLWCQIYGFDLTLGIDRNKLCDKSIKQIVNKRMEKLKQIEE